VSQPTLVHASAVILGESGVLIRGASGAGKSSLALALIDAWGIHGAFARLVSDDRVACQILNGRALLSPHSVVAGLAEWRGLGLLPQEYELKAVLRLIVDLETSPANGSTSRLPDLAELCCDFNGLKSLPRLRLPDRETYRSVATIMAFLHKLSTK
jgi:serine kinase of HPr protein (carbohydrate metabolism regulator)